MIKKILTISITLFCLINISAKSSVNFYGELESTFDSTHKREYKYNDIGLYSWGVNNYANLKITSRINDFISFGIAFNVNTFSGNYTDQYKIFYAQTAISMLIDPVEYKLIRNNYFSIPFYYKSTYVGSLDLERLFFKVSTTEVDIETGLIRIARGYSYFFKPMDIFNPVDPFNPNARPQGKIALKTTFYPADLWSIELFAIAPDDPIQQNGWGFKFGSATNFTVDRFNFEFLYSLFLPEISYLQKPSDIGLADSVNNDYSHIFGFSMKADVEIGLFTEILYRLDQKTIREKNYYGKELYFFRGLEASIGLDYTIPVANTDSKFYLLIEYLFYGSGMLDFDEKDIGELYISNDWKKTDTYNRLSLFDESKKPLYFLRHNYIFGLVKYIINTYVSLSASYLFGIDDQSALLSFIIDIEPFQAFSIAISASYPLGWEIVNNTWYPGEFGSTNSGYIQKYKISGKVKF
ncbi:MAG: hypothetical protein JXB50_06715 [Spirochaetes bacterium]|nr:hypothetical protein [Spirochaetota bacterium]